jgi:hypothetical protein
MLRVRDVPIFFQGEELPGLMGQLETRVTREHELTRNGEIQNYIRRFYEVEEGDRIGVATKGIHNDRIEYEIYRLLPEEHSVVRSKKPVGGKRSTHKTKRRATTRRLKPKRHV